MKESIEQCRVTELPNAHREVSANAVPSICLPRSRGAAPLGVPRLQGTRRGRAVAVLGDAHGALPPALPASSLHPGHFCLSTAGNAARVLVGAFAAPGVEASTQEETGANSLERLGVGLAWLSRDECWSQLV